MQKINIENLIDFAVGKSSRKELFKEGLLDIGLLLYASGQVTPDHKHSDIDEIFYIISGQGTITINNEPMLIKEKDIIFSPHGEKHGFQNTTSANWVVLQIKMTLSKED
jgi:quercetin dioxygenase-like cupin family protein